MDEVMRFDETESGMQLDDLQCKILAVRAISNSNRESPERLQDFDAQTVSDLFEAVYQISQQSSDLLLEGIISQTRKMADEKKENQ